MNAMVSKVIILVIVISGCAPVGAKVNNLEKIVGQWMYSGEASDGTVDECPDVLELKEDKSYAVLNDCYGADRQRPVVESGNWRFDDSHNQIVLENRHFESSYSFVGAEPKLTLKIHTLTEERLVFILQNNDEVIKETYERVPQKNARAS